MTNTAETALLANIEAMNRSATEGRGMDIIIVSTTSKAQENYWQERLESTRGQISNRDAIILAVHEDWPGGAGNGLGTLYAIKTANNKARCRYNADLFEKLNQHASVAVYHTAGKGTRLAPLPGSENNNKPGVKLPGKLMIGNHVHRVTILESVIKQTSIYAPSRKGRVSVFWGDQIFIPSQSAVYTPTHHADILCHLGKMPTAEDWTNRGLDKYGLIGVNGDGDAAQVEKIDYSTAAGLIEDGVLGVDKGIGVSLGSFSISGVLTNLLIQEFKPELDARQGKFDSDPHFWMPLTLNQETYETMMKRKGIDADESGKHYLRMQKLKTIFKMCCPDGRLFGAVDAGDAGYWWDYGQIKFYFDNMRKLTGTDAESAAMRNFYGIRERVDRSKLGTDVKVDDASCVLDSQIGHGTIKNSVLIGVRSKSLDIEDSVLIRATAPSIGAKSSLLYNLTDDSNLKFSENSVRADSFVPPDGHYQMNTKLDRDGGKDWFDRLSENEVSYDELYSRNLSCDPHEAEGFSIREHQRITDDFPADFTT